jgi:hypothetical protein
LSSQIKFLQVIENKGGNTVLGGQACKNRPILYLPGKRCYFFLLVRGETQTTKAEEEEFFGIKLIKRVHMKVYRRMKDKEYRRKTQDARCKTQDRTER